MAPIGVLVEASLAVANRRSDGNSVANLLVDTGFLVALYRRNDELHQSALRFLQGNREGLITVAPVIVEACHFLAIEARMHLLQWITREGLTVFEIPQAVYSKLAALMEKYRNLDCDLADVALLWLAAESRQRRILTVDERDFSTYRLPDRKQLQLVEWMSADGSSERR
ncbi:MAG: PIN domain-containing protein [Gammaproteobacteria bacterium]|nr:MAG: PIN domain-containing protein [Gammaproteobacteria bacterium]TLZ02126.1 MAG: PIN domain-containing protein [Gammaproteobacteria bacterium]TLZ38577.1 MAG: PIN domain-containing protein [Gammaproteobacteria bacterium]